MSIKEIEDTMYEVGALVVKLHVRLCPKCREKYIEILEHVKGNVKDAKDLSL